MPDKPTITALATPTGEAAIALIRVSGPLSGTIAQKAFGRESPPPVRKACLGNYRNLAGTYLDLAIYTYFEEGASYTGEPILEIACHGNPLIAQKILDDLNARGCQLAEPGEFTRTAFLNQRMDLSQAEAVMELIQAKSEKALAVAQRHLQGGLGDRVRALSGRLVQLSADMEAYIDFPEEDLPEEDQDGPHSILAKILNDIDLLIETNQYHEALSQGVRLAILGAPNAGKSSLFNALLDRDRAIVNKAPGTTRDFISERITFGTLSLEIIDTAGLRKDGSEIERIGMARTLEVAKNADFHILVLDTTAAFPELPTDLLGRLSPGNTLIAENKTDLDESRDFGEHLPALPRHRISALTGDGLDTLRFCLREKLDALVELPGEETIVINARHRTLLEEGRRLLLAAKQKFSDKAPAEFAASDLRTALETISSITETVGTEEILNEIFQKFCIGK